MKRVFLRALSIMLAVLLALGTSAIAFSAEVTDKPSLLATNFGNGSPADIDNSYPCVVLPGLSFSKYYILDENGNRIKNSDGDELFSGSFVYDKADLIRAVLKLIIPTVRTLFSQKDKGFSDAVYNLISTFTQYEVSNPDGSMKYQIDLESYDYPISGMDDETKEYYYDNIPIKELTTYIGEDMVYIYTYCPFGDILTQSAGVADYIDMVKRQTGYDKVNLITMSMGTTVLDAFLDLDSEDYTAIDPSFAYSREEMYSSINRIANLVPMFDGNEVITEMLAEDFTDNDKFYACDYLPIITNAMLGNAMLGDVLNIFGKLLPQSAREDAIDKIYQGLIDVFCYSSMTWTMVQSSRYDELAGIFLKSSECAPLKEKTDRFFEAQSDVEENLLLLNSDIYNVDIFNFVGYGIHSTVSFSALFSLTASDAETNADCLVPLSSSSLGATYVSRNEKLPDSYINSLSTTEYISPDKTVDASTCLFRDTTWFFNGQCHWAGGNDVFVNCGWLCLYGVIDDIHTDEENYPQYSYARDTFGATDEFLYKAAEILANPAGYNSALIEKLRIAYDNMRRIYLTTNLIEAYDSYEESIADAKEAVTELQNALADLGVCDPAEKSGGSEFLAVIFDKICRFLYELKGRSGFFD